MVAARQFDLLASEGDGVPIQSSACGREAQPLLRPAVGSITCRFHLRLWLCFPGWVPVRLILCTVCLQNTGLPFHFEQEEHLVRNAQTVRSLSDGRAGLWLVAIPDSVNA